MSLEKTAFGLGELAQAFSGLDPMTQAALLGVGSAGVGAGIGAVNELSKDKERRRWDNLLPWALGMGIPAAALPLAASYFPSVGTDAPGTIDSDVVTDPKAIQQNVPGATPEQAAQLAGANAKELGMPDSSAPKPETMTGSLDKTLFPGADLNPNAGDRVVFPGGLDTGINSGNYNTALAATPAATALVGSGVQKGYDTYKTKYEGFKPQVLKNKLDQVRNSVDSQGNLIGNGSKADLDRVVSQINSGVDRGKRTLTPNQYRSSIESLSRDLGRKGMDKTPVNIHPTTGRGSPAIGKLQPKTLAEMQRGFHTPASQIKYNPSGPFKWTRNNPYRRAGLMGVLGSATVLPFKEHVGVPAINAIRGPSDPNALANNAKPLPGNENLRQPFSPIATPAQAPGVFK